MNNAANRRSNRPVHLDLTTFKFPITSLASITHRISGFVLFFAIPILLYWLQSSLASEQEFDALKETLASPFLKLIIWLMLSAIAYHFVAGIKHLIMDLGIGETLEGGRLASKISIGVAAVLILIMAIWVW